MGTFYGPKLVTGGLVLCADTGNIKSYPGSGNVWNDISYNNLNLTGNSAYVNAISGVVSGASWSTGTSGTSGEDGTSGTSGSSGTAGTSGQDGSSGQSKTSGTSGTLLP